MDVPTSTTQIVLSCHVTVSFCINWTNSNDVNPLLPPYGLPLLSDLFALLEINQKWLCFNHAPFTDNSGAPVAFLAVGLGILGKKPFQNRLRA